MTTNQLYVELNYVNHSREKRLHYAHLVLEDPQLIPKLLKFMVDDKITCQKTWIFECMTRVNLEKSLPYLDAFINAHNPKSKDAIPKSIDYL